MEEEASGGRGWTRGSAGPGGDHAGNFGCLTVAPADVEHGSNQVADHMVEEAVSADSIEEQHAFGKFALLPGGGVDGTEGAEGDVVFVGEGWILAFARRLVGVCGGKTEEIVRANKMLGGGVDSAEVEGPGV